MRQLVKELNMLATTNAPSPELGDSGIAVTLPGLRVISAQDLSEDVLKRSGIERGMRVLELECGTGSASLLIAKLIGPSGLVVGVDRSAQAVDVAEKRAIPFAHGLKCFDFGRYSRFDPELLGLAVGARHQLCGSRAFCRATAILING